MVHRIQNRNFGYRDQNGNSEVEHKAALRATEGATALDMSASIEQNKIIEEQEQIKESSLENISLENATYLQNMENISDNNDSHLKLDNEIPNYEVDNIEKKKMQREIEWRNNNAIRALKLVGIKNTKFLNYPDNELDTMPFLKIVKSVEKEIYRIKPKIIFTHHYNDLNIDHRLAFESTITASRPLEGSPVNSIFSFESISSTAW